jgi:hypothetical protein
MPSESSNSTIVPRPVRPESCAEVEVFGKNAPMPA